MKQYDLTTPGGRLKYIITRLNFSQSDFATSVGLTKFDISKFINGKRQLNRETLYLIKLKYPAINIEYIADGVGGSGIEQEVKVKKEEMYINKIAKLEAENKKLKDEITFLRSLNLADNFAFCPK